MYLFSDGSVDNLSQIGCGAFLFCDDLNTPLKALQSAIQICTFPETTSTRLELQTLLFALTCRLDSTLPLTIFTDSQNIVALPERRSRLEEFAFCSKKGRPLNNADLYKAFFQKWDVQTLTLNKVKGHKKSAERELIDHIFSLVDQAAREACRRRPN